MTRTRLALVALVVTTTGGTTSCLTWTERLCSDDETYVENAAGGASCAPRRDTDPECPPGERARRQEPSGRTDCVVDEA